MECDVNAEQTARKRKTISAENKWKNDDNRTKKYIFLKFPLVILSWKTHKLMEK